MLSISEQLQREFARTAKEDQEEHEATEVPQQTPSLPPKLQEYYERERERREARSKQERMAAKAEFRANPVAYYLKVSGLPRATVAHRLGISTTAIKSWAEKPERTQLGTIRKIELLLLEMEKSGKVEGCLVSAF